MFMYACVSLNTTDPRLHLKLNIFKFYLHTYRFTNLRVCCISIKRENGVYASLKDTLATQHGGKVL